MFAMTSFGGEVDDDISKGQVSHRLGSFCPEGHKRPRFLQLYIVDTENEVSNKLYAFNKPSRPPLDEKVVVLLMNMLNVHNEYVRTFKTARDLAAERERVGLI